MFTQREKKVHGFFRKHTDESIKYHNKLKVYGALDQSKRKDFSEYKNG